MRKGILLVAFGSSRQEAHLSLRQFEDRVRSRFPDIPVRWGFTSGIVRGKLADKGKKTDSSDKALQKMLFERYTHVAVQSLHVITGNEYEALAADVKQFEDRSDGFASVSLGRPLIASEVDVPRVVRAIMSHLPPERKPGEAVVLMGHGTWHAGDSLYDTLYEAMQAEDSNIFVATMDGRLTIESVRDELLNRGMRMAWLVPLLALPGRHVQNDMCGTGPQSWVSILDAAGISTSCVVRGTAEYGEFADIWLDHLAEALDQL
ncbi:MAG: sirohydrochlorin cobaltochelatase [Proteobacteria bacterium]|nr:sirohydrochlorin cobaltochelatase [Pseudomonadota bacterium]